LGIYPIKQDAEAGKAGKALIMTSSMTGISALKANFSLFIISKKQITQTHIKLPDKR
jgi:hypothetical protein